MIAAKIVDKGRVEEQTIEPIEYAAVTRQDVGCVLGSGSAFEGAFREVTEDSNHRHDRREG